MVTIPDASIVPPVKFPFSYPLKRLFFNAFEISSSRIPGFWFFSFGYMERLDLLDEYRCVASAEAVTNVVEGLRVYIRELGLPSAGFERVGMPSLLKPSPIEPIDLVGVARRNTLAEISLHCFSWHRTYETSQLRAGQQTVSQNDLQRGTVESYAFNVCLLRSSVDVQKAWILDLMNMHDSRRGNV